MLEDVLKYNEGECLPIKWIMCGIDGRQKSYIIMNGYVRELMDPFVGIIPLDVMDVCFVFLFDAQWSD